VSRRGPLILGLCLSLLLAACTNRGGSGRATSSPAPKASVTGVGLERLHRAWDPVPGQKRWDPTVKAEVSLQGFIFFRSDGRLSGSENCNGFSGSYDTTPNGGVRSGPLTMMLGSGCGSENNYALMDIAKAAKRWQIQGDQLTLFDGAGAVLATFAPDPYIEPA
jgi:heat shock protein HslJ